MVLYKYNLQKGMFLHGHFSLFICKCTLQIQAAFTSGSIATP